MKRCMVQAKNHFLLSRFGILLLFYYLRIWDARNIENDNDSYTDTASETGTEIEMQRMNIDRRVVEGAKAETAQPITQVQPVYVRD